MSERAIRHMTLKSSFVELVRGAGLPLFLTSVDLRISMSELYEEIAIPAETVAS
jgi:hypothetical protein